MNNTRIEWTEKTWNPITGCTKISPGCAHCYAETMTRRLCAMGVRKYRNGFTPTTHSETLEDMVVYRGLYGEFGLWVRPAAMWNEIVERDGKTYRRFTYLGE